MFWPKVGIGMGVMLKWWGGVVEDQSSVVPMREPFLKAADLSLSEKDFTLLGRLGRGWTEAAFEG
jgi:hypothetical protein